MKKTIEGIIKKHNLENKFTDVVMIEDTVSDFKFKIKYVGTINMNVTTHFSLIDNYYEHGGYLFVEIKKGHNYGLITWPNEVSHLLSLCTLKSPL
jgi:hypothetical protein